MLQWAPDAVSQMKSWQPADEHETSDLLLEDGCKKVITLIQYIL